MLPREKRLRDTRDFKRVYQKGSFFSVRLCSVNYIPNRMDFSRIGIVVGKKFSQKAVERNSVKRKAREAARKLYDKAPTGYDIIINIKKEAKSASVSDFEKELAGVFGRLEKR